MRGLMSCIFTEHTHVHVDHQQTWGRPLCVSCRWPINVTVGGPLALRAIRTSCTYFKYFINKQKRSAADAARDPSPSHVAAAAYVLFYNIYWPSSQDPTTISREQQLSALTQQEIQN